MVRVASGSRTFEYENHVRDYKTLGTRNRARIKKRNDLIGARVNLLKKLATPFTSDFSTLYFSYFAGKCGLVIDTTGIIAIR